MKIKICIWVLLQSIFSIAFSQEVYHHVSNKGVYNFIDEMANEKIIELNSVIKPYSRKFIAEQLQIVSEKQDLLNKRQSKELEFYLKDFSKELYLNKDFDKRIDLFYYRDSLFAFSINPIGGIQYWTNNNGTAYHRWSGAEVFSYAGNFGVYASLRDNHENKFLSKEKLLNTRQGGNYKYTSDGGGDYSEMRGGITYDWNWGSIGLVKDHFEWGNYSYFPNILSAKAPSVPQLKLNMKPVKWFEFNYMHAWLVSEVVDSAASFSFINSYGIGQRDVAINKYLAANMFSFRPLNYLWLSFGNSVIYSMDNVHPGYLIPVMFYKSVDHTLNSTDKTGRNMGQNSQMFFDISSRQLKHLHLHATMFIDELSVARFFDDEEFNFVSYKVGGNISGLIPNISFQFEGIRTNPLVYKHHIPVTTFESNGYNLGHYLQDNSRSLYMAIVAKPLPKLNCRVSYIVSQHGPDHTELGTYRIGIPFLESIDWKQNSLRFAASYQLINDGFLFLSFEISETTGNVSKYTNPLYHGEVKTLGLGFNYGF